MSARRIAVFIALSATFMATTWIGGWWTVPIVALVAGVTRLRPGRIALAASIAWLVLLGADAIVGGEAFGRLVVVLSGVLGFPAIVVTGLTVVFPGILGWSAAVLGEWMRDLLAGLRGPEMTGEPDEA